MNIEFLQLLDKSIKEIWLKEVKQDYDSDSLLKEDTLKNSIYHHLRNRLDKCNLDNIKVYTEFTNSTLQNSGSRADIAVVKLKDEFDEDYLGDNVDEILAIIEIKFKGNRCAPWVLMSDIDKIKTYIRKYKMVNCQMYLGFMHEYSYSISEMKWLNKRASLTWAKDKVTELTANKFDELGDDMKFLVYSYNNFNDSLNCTDIINYMPNV
jgi:hypothetical protein